MNQSLNTICLTDKYHVVRDVFSQYFSGRDDFQILTETDDVQELWEWLNQSERKPDICIVSMMFPSLETLKVLESIKKSWPEIKLLMLINFRISYFLFELWRIGAKGCIYEFMDIADLDEAVDTILQDKHYFASEQELAFFNAKKHLVPPVIFSATEQLLIEYSSRHLTVLEIADQFNIKYARMRRAYKRLSKKVGIEFPELTYLTQLSIVFERTGHESNRYFSED